MSYQLVIAEKPSVARSIAGVIGADKKQDGYMEGNGYLVSWLSEKSKKTRQKPRKKEHGGGVPVYHKAGLPQLLERCWEGM